MEITVDQGDTEQGTKCVDDVDGTLDAVIKFSTVDDNTLGRSAVFYVCVDSNGNSSSDIQYATNINS